MLRLAPYAALIAALAAGAGWLDHRAYWRGWDAYAAEVAENTQRKNRELAQLARENAALSAALKALRSERDQIDREVRDAIADHPDADAPGLPAGIMRELNRHR